MKCVNHPEIDAVAVCVRCGKEVCIDCKRELGMNIYCLSCTHEILTKEAEPPNAEEKGTKSKIAGRRLLVLGTVGCVLAVLSAMLAFAMGGNDNPKVGTGIVVYISMALFIISPVLFTIGLTRAVTGATGISLAALVCGILSLLSFIAPLLSLISLLLGLSAIILGSVSLVKLKKHALQAGCKTAIAGLILGIIGIVASGIWYLVVWH